MTIPDRTVPPGTPAPSSPPPTPRPRPGPGRMEDNEWPDGVPFPSFRKQRYPKTPKAPKPSKDLHGSCSRSLPAAVFLTVTEMFLHWRELAEVWRETGELYR